MTAPTGPAPTLERAGEPAAPTSPSTPDGDGVLRTRETRLAPALVLALAVVPITALFAWAAMHGPVNFDGAMNLQVARNLADGDGYMRFYGEERLFPHEVQTNGPYMFLAASVVAVLGPTQFAWQLANVVFVAGFAAVVSLLLAREHVIVRILGPAAVLLILPQVAVLGLGGVGEVPTAFLLLTSLLCIVQGVRTPPRAPLWVLGAAVAAGAAVTTKTFAIGALPALAVGVLAVLIVAPTHRTRWRILLAGGGIVLAPIAVEVYRLTSLGSMAAYHAWWSTQRGGITKQSGLGDTDRGLWQTFLDHTHVLSRAMGEPAELLLVILCLPLVWVAGTMAWRWRQQGVVAALRNPSLVARLVLAVLAASYIAWWLLLLPDAKLWVRRMSPGLFAVQLLYVLLAAWLVRVTWSGLRRRRAATATHPHRSRLAAAVGLLAVAVIAAPFTWRKVDGNIRGLVHGQRRWLHMNEQAADHIAARPDLRYHGDDWWSAPVLSLMSGTDFANLSRVDACTLDPARDRLVWDYDAKSILSPVPSSHGGELVYEETATFGPYVSIYTVGPAPGLCD